MSLLAPAALLLGLLSLPIILLYLLRVRRREQVVSSTLLWRELTLDRTANAPWQRLRRNLLLFLQILILLALVLALARPALQLPGLGGDRLIVLLDASASMQATDGRRGARFDDAVAEAGRLIETLGGGEQMTLIEVGRTPVVLAAATGDQNALLRALAMAAPQNSAGDWPAAFALAASVTPGTGRSRVVILSDGNLPDGLPSLPGEVSYVPFGRAADNLAISALSARPNPSTGEADLLVAVANPGPTSREALLTIRLDGALYTSQRIVLEAGGLATHTWSLPAGQAIIEAQLEPRDSTADYFPLDDRAWAAPGGGGTQRVLLAGEGNLFLERIFTVMPGYELFRVPAEDAARAAAEASEPFDLFVFDGVALPPGGLPGHSLIFDPQPTAETETPILTVSGVFSDTAVVREADSPLLENVDWRGVSVAAASRVEAPALQPLVEAEGGPLLLAGEFDGQRVVVFPFDLRASDLPLQIAFPIIMANITGWLSPGRVIGDENPQPGAAVAIVPNARTQSVSVVLPDGQEWQQRVDAAGQPITFSQTGQMGVYEVSLSAADGTSQPGGNFAVNFFDPAESRIQPAESLQLGTMEIAAGTSAIEGLREFWPWLLVAGLLILFVEWWVAYQPGQVRPRVKIR